MENTTVKDSWFNKWTWKKTGWAFLAFLLIGGITGLFTWFFDIHMTGIGYIYVYFTILLYTVIIYFFTFWLKIPWLGTFTFGLNGIIGIPIEWWQEYLLAGTLKGVWGAFAWGGIYILYGLALDLSFIFLKPEKNEFVVTLLSSLIFSVFFFVISILPLSTFYNTGIIGVTGIETYLTYWYFLIPFGIIEGVLGALLGMFLGKGLREKRTEAKSKQELIEKT